MAMLSLKQLFFYFLSTNKRVAIRAAQRLGDLPSCLLRRGLPWTSPVVRLATVSAIAVSTPLFAAPEASLCGPQGGHVFERATYFQGRGLIRLDEDRTIQLILEPAERGKDLELFRIAFFQEAGPFDAGLLPEADIPVPITILERRATWYHEIEVFVDDDAETTFTFFVDSRDCRMPKPEFQHYLSKQIYPAAALWRSSLAAGTQLDAPKIREAFAHPLIVSESDASTQSVLWCQAGGPGASSCSINFGSIGPIGSGGCSVSCVPPQYACCGLGFGSNCECRSPSGSGGSGGGGGWLPPWWPWPGDDGDDGDPSDPEDEQN